MQTLRLHHKVTSDHRISLTLPPEFPVGDVEIIVRSANRPTPADGALAQQQSSDLNSFFEFLQTVPPTGRSREEIDRQIQAERDSWE